MVFAQRFGWAQVSAAVRRRGWPAPQAMPIVRAGVLRAA